MEIIKVDPKEFGLEETKVKSIEEAFIPKINEREVLSEVYKNILSKELSPEVCEEAKDCRKKLVKVRTGIASIHKTQKSFFLAAGKFVDAWKNKETEPVQQMEEKLSEIENHFINLEKERISSLANEREGMLRSYNVEYFPDQLGEMPEEAFKNMLNGAKLSYEQAQKEAEEEKRKVEEARRVESLNQERVTYLMENDLWGVRGQTVDITSFGTMEMEDWKSYVNDIEKIKKAAIEAAENIIIENERLKKEAEERDRIARDEKAKRDAEIENERQRRIDAENEIKAREDAETARIQGELSKKDADKVINLIKDLESLQTKYQFRSKKNKKMYQDVNELIGKIINHIDNGKVRGRETNH